MGGEGQLREMHNIQKKYYGETAAKRGQGVQGRGGYILNGAVREGLTEVTCEQRPGRGRESMSICHQGF